MCWTFFFELVDVFATAERNFCLSMCVLRKQSVKADSLVAFSEGSLLERLMRKRSLAPMIYTTDLRNGVCQS